MICDDALVAVSHHADGELDAPDADRLAAHLAGCAGCRAFDRQVRDLRAGLRFEPVAGAPDIAGPVLARLRPAEATRAPPAIGSGGGRSWLASVPPRPPRAPPATGSGGGRSWRRRWRPSPGS